MPTISATKRLGVFAASGGRCFFCGKAIELSDMTVDHLTPRSQGGTNAHSNLVAACRACNEEKADAVIQPELWIALRGAQS